MTLHDVRRLSDYAKLHPPVRVLVSYCALALGVKLPEPPDPNKKSKYMTAEELRRMVDTTGGRVPGMGPV